MKVSDCASTRKTTKLFDYSESELNTVVWTHKCCICNEKIALEQRHQVDDGSRYTSTLNLHKHLRPLVKRLSPSTQEYIIKRYSGPKRKLLEQAAEDLEIRGVEVEDSRVKMFLKADKYHDSTKFGAPRCIQYRSKRYCLRLATYLHPIEQMVYKYLDMSLTPMAAKSRNLIQRGQDLRAKWEMFNNPIAILLDHSTFDAHCGVELLKLEHEFYTSCIRVTDGKRELKKLLAWQLVNKGATKNSTMYETYGTRMSGDQNTGLGNTLINYAMLKSFADKHLRSATFYVDGDDSVIMCEREDMVALEIIAKYFSQFGMKTKVEVAHEFEKVEFCQTRPCFDGTNWRMVRNPNRLLSRLPWIVYNLHPNCHDRYLKSVGMCEMALGIGLPIGQYIGDKLRVRSRKRYMITDLHYVAIRENVKPTKVKLVQPTIEARESYARAWDISVPDQLRIERCFIRPPTLPGEALQFEDTPYLHHQ